MAVSVAALTILDLSKVNVALPSIERALDAPSTALQLVVSGYVLTFGLTLVPMGRLGDQRSRRALFVVGLSLFGLTSLVCALAPSTEVLLVGRLLQGVAAGIQMPQVLGLIQQTFTGTERGRAFGLFGATIGVATAFGPTLGGLLIAVGGPTDGWRLIFWMNVPLCLVAIGLAIWVLPRSEARAERRALELDPVGVLLLGCVVVALLWPFLLTTGAPDDDPRRWWTLVAFGAFAVAFVAWERRYAAGGRTPLVPFRLFATPSFRNGTLLATCYFAGLPAMFLVTTLFLQEGLGLDALHAGMVSIGFATAGAIASWVGGSLVNRLGRPLVIGGLLVMLAGVGGLALVSHLVPTTAAPFAMAGVMLLAGFGSGVVISPNQTLTLAEVPPADGGVAGSMGQLGQRTGTAIGTAIALALFYSTVYADRADGLADLTAYRDAYGYGLLVVGVALSAALAIGIADVGRRRRQERPAPGRRARAVDEPVPDPT